MNVSLTPELERYINEKVEGGSYRSASEVVRESVRLMQRVEEDRATRLAALRHEVGLGLAQIERGETVDGREAFAAVLDSLKQGERR